MKYSESWLREWVNPKLSHDDLATTLTMAGLEVEELAAVANKFTGVVVGQVLKVSEHPSADHLHVCEVNTGNATPLTIVCAASNVRLNMKTAVALVNAKLPNNKTIASTSIRDVISSGMLCSLTDIGLAESSEGIIEFPQDAPLGQDVWTYLQLDDFTLELGITPNRGDCLSVAGLARELAALTKTSLNAPMIKPVVPSTKTDTLSVNVAVPPACPRYVGRSIHHINKDAITPTLIKERLRRSGIRAIHPIVDVTNYVMLELGQPMHAFDLDTIKSSITVRFANNGETIALLDGSNQKLMSETLLIADAEKPLAIAGVMGGQSSSVTSETSSIFLESAYFSPEIVARQRQYYGLNSDSAYRFERGVAPDIQCIAIERATALIKEIAGGEVGPLVEVISENAMPKRLAIDLSREKIANVLGISISDQAVETILQSLGFICQRQQQGWQVTAPLHRFDINLPEDVIEEIARLYGYDNIPTHEINAKLRINEAIHQDEISTVLSKMLSDLGYYEIISYSFIDKKIQACLDPNATSLSLLNPISADMSVMRTNLWPGLVGAMQYNSSRQQYRTRLFETGTCFLWQENQLIEQTMLAGLIAGLNLPEQWGVPAREVDFYDLKGDIANLLAVFHSEQAISFKAYTHPALHPGQTAGIYCQEQRIGLLGALHPSVLQTLDIPGPVFVFELEVENFKRQTRRPLQEISKFPEIRRDMAIIVNQAVPAKDIQDTIKECAGDWLKDIFIFDVYQGKGILPGHKSIALALILQHPTRTLVEDEVAELLSRVMITLKGQFDAALRS